MTGTITNVVKQFKNNWTTLLEPEAIQAACRQLGHQWRDSLLNPVVTLQLFFLQILHGNTACEHLRHLSKMEFTASAYCQARMKLPLALFRSLLSAVSQRLQKTTLEQGRWLGHRTFFVDGSSFSMPDTVPLQARFGQPGAQRVGCGFPVAHLMALFHAGSGMLLEVFAAPLRVHDMSQVAQVHPALCSGDVLIADRGFCSYVHLALLLQRQVQAVLRVHQKQIVNFTPSRRHGVPGKGKSQQKRGQPRSRWICQLAGADQIVEWLKPPVCPKWINAAQFAALPDSLRVRELQYQVQRPGFRVKTITLVTTLLDADIYTVEKLSQLYFARWQVEVNFGHLKTTMGLDVLKCKTVEGVLKELIVFALVYNLIRLVMLEAARRQGVDVERISFIDASRWLASACEGKVLSRLVVNPHRRYRYEPRVRKRRPKQYPLMKAPRAELRKSLTNNVDSD